MLCDVSNVLILWDDDDTEILSVALKISLNSEVRSISRRIHAVREALLIEDRINRYLNKVVEFQAAVNTSMFVQSIWRKHLSSEWNLVSHINRRSSNHLERINRDKIIGTVVIGRSRIVRKVNDISALAGNIGARNKAHHIPKFKMIFVHIDWYDLQVGAGVLVDIESFSINKEHPDVSIEVGLVELAKFNISGSGVNTLVKLLIVVCDPAIIFVASEDWVKVRHPDILHIEQNKFHIVSVALNNIRNFDSVLQDSLLTREVKWINSEWVHAD